MTGSKGQIGSALRRALAPLGDLVATSRADLDLLAPGAVERRIAQERPDVIVNAAAYTGVDRAERERELAFRVNAEAVGRIGRAAADCGALVVHFSTDYVFDGEKPAPYVESDPARPLGVYGASKLAGERALGESGCRHFIFRTSWVYGPRGRNFLLAILAAARTQPELRVVDDQHGAPTSSRAIAEATAQALAAADLAEKPGGVYHLSAAGRTTWCGFARLIVERAGMKLPVVAIRSVEYPVAVRRPANSLLDNSKIVRTFGIVLRDWREDVPAAVAATIG